MVESLKKLMAVLGTKDKFKLVVLFLMMLVGAVLEAVSIGVVAGFVAVVANPEALLEKDYLESLFIFFSIENSRDVLVYGAVFLIIIFVFKNLYIAFYKYTKARFVYNRYKSISERLFSAYMSAPYSFHLKRNSAEIIRNISSEAKTVASEVMMPALHVATEVLVSLGILTLLFISEPVVTVVTIFLLGGISVIFLKLTRVKMQWYGKKAQEERKDMVKIVQEGVGGFKEVVVLGREGWFVKSFKRSIKNLAKAHIFKETLAKIVRPIIETIAIVGMLTITLILFFQGYDIVALASVLALFALSIRRLVPAVETVVSKYSTLRYNIYAVNPVYEDLLKLENKQKKERNDTEGKIGLKKQIKIDNVCYSYPEAKESVIKNISLVINKGEAVGFVGKTGSGKTTLIDIILGLFPPSKGDVLIDGVSVNKNTAAWQRNIGYVPQFIYLSDDTIRNNIAFGLQKENISEEKVKKAVEVAQLKDFVDELEDGLDTVIGESGVRLSGGQRQRVGIARALYNNPEVLIMDEATSSLDNVTEKFVIDAIERLKEDRTIIIIAHRLTTVKNCDKLYILEKGEVVDSGSYSELSKRNEQFKEVLKNNK